MTETKTKTSKARFRHGTVSGYNAHECRCAKCSKAWAAKIAERRDGRPKLKRGDPRHGLNGYTNYRCKCEICRLAFSKYQAKRRLTKKLEEEVEG